MGSGFAPAVRTRNDGGRLSFPEGRAAPRTGKPSAFSVSEDPLSSLRSPGMTRTDDPRDDLRDDLAMLWLGPGAAKDGPYSAATGWASSCRAAGPMSPFI